VERLHGRNHDDYSKPNTTHLIAGVILPFLPNRGLANLQGSNLSHYFLRRRREGRVCALRPHAVVDVEGNFALKLIPILTLSKAMAK
jgi:hypothetical protein